MSRLIEPAIRLLMQVPRTPRRKDRFELVTFGAGGRFSRHNLDKISSLVEEDDLDRLQNRR